MILDENLNRKLSEVIIMKNKNASAGVFWMIVGAIIVGGLLIGLGKTVYDRFEGGTLSIDGLDPSSLV